MIHLAAFYSSIDPAGANVALAASTDQVLNVQGNNVRVPPGMNFVSGFGVNLIDNTGYVGSQLQAPSMRDKWYPDNPYFEDDIGWNHSLAPLLWLGENAIELVPAENLNFFVQFNPAAATATYGLVWLSDGPLQPVTGEIRTVRATATITQVAGTWVNGALTFSQTLPYGDYQVVGLRAVAATQVACRLVFAGGIWRPGVITNTGGGNIGMPQLANGMGGDMGVFNTNTPPSLEVMGTAGATDCTVWLDLIKVG